MPVAPRAATAFSVVAAFGPPLPASGVVFTFPPASNLVDTQARVLWADVRVLKTVAGLLLQEITVNDATGATVFSAGLTPLLNTVSPTPQSVQAIAGPEQARVPFFVPNILIGTFPKDLYCLPGYSLRLNNLGAVAGTSAVVTVFFERDGD